MKVKKGGKEGRGIEVGVKGEGGIRQREREGGREGERKKEKEGYFINTGVSSKSRDLILKYSLTYPVILGIGKG